MIKIFLDDIRESPYGWTKTKTPTDTIFLLKNYIVDEISLDHDLGLENETGYDVITWIERQVFTNNYIPPKIHVHTSNPSARDKMNRAVRRIEKEITKDEERTI